MIQLSEMYMQWIYDNINEMVDKLGFDLKLMTGEGGKKIYE